MKSEVVEKFSLLIIESLPDTEKKTGFDLYSSIIKYKQFQEPNLSSEYYDVNSKKDFLNLLESVIADAINQNHFYILHFEIHGFDDGIILKNGEDVSWDEMMPYFRKLNVHYKNFLAIYLAVCKGANLLKYINPLERAPFKVLISSAKNIYIRDIINGFEEFYSHFFFSFDPCESLIKYNSVVTNPKDRLVIVTSEYCFDTICDIKRETVDIGVLIKAYKPKLLEEDLDLKYLPEDYTNKFTESKLKELFDELKLKRDYFLMNDLNELYIN